MTVSVPTSRVHVAAPSFARAALGAAMLAAEQLKIRTPESLAIAVGLAGQGRDTAARAAGRVRKAVARVTPAPPDRVSRYLDMARLRGTRTIASGKREASARLHEAMDSSISW